MYLRLARLRRFSGHVSNGRLGSLETLYFDQDDWAVRFIAFSMSSPSGATSSALVSPLQIEGVDIEQERIELEAGHDVYRFASGDRRRPLPSEVTARIVQHYELPDFWDGSGVWGDHRIPGGLRSAPGPQRRPSRGVSIMEQEAQRPPRVFPHNLLMGRGVFSPDGRLGVISDLLIDPETWRIRYFIIWLQAPGENGEVLLSPFWVNGPPEKQKVTVPMTTEAIVSGPNFVPEDLEPLDEQILARYFGFLTEQ